MSFIRSGNRGIKAIESAVCLAILSGGLGAVAIANELTIKRARELALRADLQALRATVAFYHARHGSYPAGLTEALAQPIKGSRNTSAGDWWSQSPLAELKDSFGNTYHYEASTGIVHSRTSGYQEW